MQYQSDLSLSTMTELFEYAHKALEFIQTLKLEGTIKLLAVGITCAIVWPIGQRVLKVYDITIINRLSEPCKFATLRSACGSNHIKGSDDNEISSLRTMHYQVVPGWRGLVGRNTLLIRLMRTNEKRKEDNKSVIIPIYNSGDIQRSRLFFIEDSGVREISTTVEDTWNWSDYHVFGQQGN